MTILHSLLFKFFTISWGFRLATGVMFILAIWRTVFAILPILKTHPLSFTIDLIPKFPSFINSTFHFIRIQQIFFANTVSMFTCVEQCSGHPKVSFFYSIANWLFMQAHDFFYRLVNVHCFPIFFLLHAINSLLLTVCFQSHWDWWNLGQTWCQYLFLQIYFLNSCARFLILFFFTTVSIFCW